MIIEHIYFKKIKAKWISDDTTENCFSAGQVAAPSAMAPATLPASAPTRVEQLLDPVQLGEFVISHITALVG